MVVFSPFSILDLSWLFRHWAKSELILIQSFCNFFICSVLNDSISFGMYHVFWHLLTLRFWYFTILHFIWGWGKFDIFHLEVIIVRWSWSWLLESHIQVLDSGHCGIHHWWEMLHLLYWIQYSWNPWRHYNLWTSCCKKVRWPVGQVGDKWGTREGTRRGPEGSCMYSSVGEGRPSDAGAPRFDPHCPPLHQSHVIYEVFVTCSWPGVRIMP